MQAKAYDSRRGITAWSLTAALAAASVPAAAIAAPPSASRRARPTSATIEVTDGATRGGKARTARFVLALGRGLSQFEAQDGRATYKIAVQCRRDRAHQDNGAPLVDFDLRRIVHGMARRGARSMRIRVTRRVRVAKRVVVGELTGARGGAARVALTVR